MCGCSDQQPESAADCGVYKNTADWCLVPKPASLPGGGWAPNSNQLSHSPLVGFLGDSGMQLQSVIKYISPAATFPRANQQPVGIWWGYTTNSGFFFNLMLLWTQASALQARTKHAMLVGKLENCSSYDLLVGGRQLDRPANAVDVRHQTVPASCEVSKYL